MTHFYASTVGLVCQLRCHYSLRLSATAGRSVLICFALLLAALTAQAQNNWTGNANNRDWNTAGNWASGAVPTATDDVVIPSGPANQPVLSTTATAKSVEVQTGASLTITSAGSLTINNSRRFQTFTASFWNKGGVVCGGQLIINNPTVPVYGLVNSGNFDNVAGGQISIDGANSVGLYNIGGGFVNSATITIGKMISVGQYGVFNTASFNNSGCSALLWVVSNAFITDQVGGALSNTGTIIENASGTSNISTNSGLVQNLNGGTFTITGTNTGVLTTSPGTIWTGCTSRDWNTTSNWSGGALPTATDDAVIPSGPTNQLIISTIATAKSVEVQSGASLSIASGGSLTLNGSKNLGNISGGITAFFNAGAVNNSGQVVIGNSPTASVGQLGINNLGTFANNTGGNIAVDRTSVIGIRNISGSFTNSATITIGAVAAVGLFGIENGNSNSATFQNNTGGSITIDRSSNGGLHNSSGSFTNSATLTIGAAVGSFGILNDGNFQNTGCDARINIVADAIISNSSTFSNTGTIIENATGSSNISSNAGLVQNLNGGTFTIGTNTGVLTTTPGPQPTITANPSLTITQGQSTILTASGATTYQWSTTETINPITVSPRTTVPYSVRGTTNGCSSVTTVTVTVNAPGCGAGLSGPIWTGCVSTDWNTAGNWASGAVPTATDDVVIPSAPANQPVLSTTATAKSVEVQMGASLSISSGGSLTLNGSKNVDGFTTAFSNRGMVQNAGLLILGNTADVGAFAIWNRSSFTNNGGEIRIDRTTNQGINNNVGLFTNTGTITIGALASVGQQGILNQATFTHTGGTITIDRTTSDGLLNSGNFVNSATITIGRSASPGEAGLTNSGSFTNATGGRIQIDRSTLRGLFNQGGNFTNSATITIGATAAVGSSGLYNLATFANQAGGRIQLDNSTGSGLFNAISSRFTNSAMLIIGANAAVGLYGLYNRPSATFENQAGGYIQLDNSTFTGLYNPGDTFINSGTITIGSLGTIGGTGIRNEGPFANSACATLTVLAPIINNSNSFTNAGLFTVNTTRTHIGNGTLINNGIIDYPQGNPIPNVVNNDVIASAISSCSNTISPALQLGGNSNQFMVGTTWYTDQELTQSAGTYDQGSNTFTATNLAAGSSTLLYFAATDNANGCSRTVSVSVMINAVVSLSIAANPSLTITQGQSATLTASGASSYNWSSGAATAAISVSVAGPYSVTGTTGGCSSVTSVVVTVNPVQTGPFAITAVTTLSCTPVQPNRFSISFSPQYQGTNGQSISFDIPNELLPTTETGPYTIQLYSDNPLITLRATQNGTPGGVTFRYDWLAACRSSESTNTPPRLVMAIPPQSATVGVGYSYVIPAGTFTDDQTPGSLQLSAAGLPPGISLSGYTLSGMPTTTLGSPYPVTITATDPGGLRVSTTLAFSVAPAPVTPPDPTQPFAITGVTTISCTPVANRINVNFTPRYGGLNGQSVAFRVQNELVPTNEPGPYSLTLYRDNPVITLKATQTGSVGEASFAYNWLEACATAGQDNTPPRLNEPVASQTVVVGQGYSLNLSNTFLDQETPSQITLTASGLPAGLSLVGKLISGTVSSTVGSPYSVSLTATDGGGLSAGTGFLITVVPASVLPPPTAPFSITGVQTVSCEVISAGQRRVTFTPQYGGLDGSAVSFSVVSELSPTSDPGPYVLSLYTDNSVITLRAVQSGVESTYRYGWLGVCNAGARVSAESDAGLQVVVLGNPVSGETVDVEVRSTAGQRLSLTIMDERGYVVSDLVRPSVDSVERVSLKIGRAAGVYLLQVKTPTQQRVLKLIRY